MAESLHFSKAAEQLYIAQPSLSHQISQLEKEIGGLLFIRNNRNVTLTPTGELLYEDAKNILTLSEAALIRARESAKNHQKNERIVVGIDSNLQIMMEYIFRFRERWPQVEIILKEIKPINFEEMLNSRKVDVCFSFVFNTEECKVRTKALSNSSLKFVLKKDLLQSTPGDTILEKLGMLPCIVLQAKKHGQHELGLLLNKIHLDSQIIYAESLIELLLHAEGGFGYTILPKEVAVQHMSDDLAMFDLPDHAGDIILVLAWNDDKQSDIVKKFISI